MSAETSNNPELAAILAKMADLPGFLGINLSGVNDRDPVGDTPLHVAAVWGDVKVGKLLLEAGADPNVHGEYGYTPLHEAALRGNADFVKLLLANGASKELRNEDGQTPMDLVEQSENAPLKQILS